jgi:hypothetical protein
MKALHTQRILAWVIALFAVAVAWQINFPNVFDSAASSLGITKGTFLHQVIVDFGIALALVGISWAALHVYEDVIWQLWPNLGNKGGWWIYSLISRRENRQTEVIGVFRLIHTVSTERIEEGHAEYHEKGRTIPRGNWHAETVWIRGTQIQIIFHMHATNPLPQAMPSSYEGYMSLLHTERKPLAGIESWEGYFHDLGDRSSTAGWIYCERLSPLSIRDRRKAEHILKDSLHPMMRRVRSIVVPSNGAK